MVSINIIKTIIDEWDPIDLLSHAPSDEYHSEIEEIEQLLKSAKDKVELSTGIYNIFIKSFGEFSFQKAKSECDAIAQKILLRSTM